MMLRRSHFWIGMYSGTFTELTGAISSCLAGSLTSRSTALQMQMANALHCEQNHTSVTQGLRWLAGQKVQ